MSEPAIIQFSLQLRACASRMHEPVAWFIPGDRPGQWLGEMTAWDVPLANARLYLVPASGSDNRAIGLLVVVKELARNIGRALPYGRVGDLLFIPVDSCLDPACSADELARNLQWDVQVLHPTAGLSGFAIEDALSVVNLISPPPRRSADWNHAVARAKLNDRLRSVRAEELPPVDFMIQTGRDDIGTETEQDVPLLPDESPRSDAVRAAITRGMLPIMSALQRMLSMGNRSAGKAGGLQRWATAKLAAMTAAMEAHRFRELQRLMDLMKRDPDAGLKFALPLRDMMTRGVAPPSASLVSRNVDFNLASILGGGQSGDSWNVPADIRQNLQKQYRDAANRELNLGRYRRAAYIFAHLLGDFHASASALKQGRHFREAAAIYTERLNNRRASADCLTEGGLLHEAIELYHELRVFELAGDLYERLGEHDNARNEWGCQLQLLTERGDILASARLLETKLNDPDQALMCLEAGWPNSDKAELCLAEWFNLSGRLARHSEAARRIASLREQALLAHRYLPLVKTLARQAGIYPDAEVRFKAADATRVISGQRLMRDPSADRRQFVEAVVSLVPQDRLLDRDGHRFISKAKPRPRAIAVRGFTPTILNRFQLPGGFDWVQAVSISGGFLALGVSDGLKLISLVRGNWRGQFAQAQVVEKFQHYRSVLLAPSQKGSALVASVAVRNWPTEALVIPKSDNFDRDLVAIQPTFSDPLFLGACRDEKGLVASLTRAPKTQGVTLLLHDDEKLLSTHSVEIEPVGAGIFLMPMAMRRGLVYIAHASALFIIKPGVSLQRIALPAIARGLTGSPTFTVTRMIVTFDDGGVIVRENGEYRRFGQSLISPVATFTPDGSLVAIGQNAGQIYPPEVGKPASPSSFETGISKPLAVLPANNGQFAIFDPAGSVIVYELPR